MSLPRRGKTATAVAIIGLTWSPLACAECDLADAVGYTIAAAKQVESWIQDNQRHDGFEGCEYDRILVFSDGTGLRCTSFRYQYSYNPKAVLLVNNYRAIKACIGGEWYDLRPLN